MVHRFFFISGPEESVELEFDGSQMLRDRPLFSFTRWNLQQSYVEKYGIEHTRCTIGTVVHRFLYMSSFYTQLISSKQWLIDRELDIGTNHLYRFKLPPRLHRESLP